MKSGILISMAGIFLFLMNAPGNSQHALGSDILSMEYIMSDIIYNHSPGNIGSFKKGESDIIGSPYVFDDFLSGEIVLVDSMRAPDMKINFDAYNNQMVIYYNEETYLINDHLVSHFIIPKTDSKEARMFKNLIIESDKIRTFLELDYDGKSDLYVRYTKKFLKADYEKPFGNNRRFDEYKDKNLYYVSIGGGPVQELKTSNKQVTELFEGKSAEIGAFLKQEKIDLKDRQDIVKLLDYYDSL